MFLNLATNCIPQKYQRSHNSKVSIQLPSLKPRTPLEIPKSQHFQQPPLGHREQPSSSDKRLTLQITVSGWVAEQLNIWGGDAARARSRVKQRLNNWAARLLTRQPALLLFNTLASVNEDLTPTVGLIIKPLGEPTPLIIETPCWPPSRGLMN